VLASGTTRKSVRGGAYARGMGSGVYITAAEGFSGKSTVALGLTDALAGTVSTVGVFRPVARSGDDRDYVLELLLSPRSC